jgi:S-adenosylmethionine hydrolase
MARPIVALLTDFGLTDHYVGSMKGVVAGICPEASLIDITHGVPAHDVLAGALALEAAAEMFPPGTILLSVVDPGVGTARRGIAAAVGPQIYVGPDNGLVTLLARLHGVGEAVELTERRFQRVEVSRTFEGRDRFAPAAAWIAAGTPLASFGAPAKGLLLLDVPEARVSPELVAGEVLAVDRFGNLTTSIRRAVLDEWCGGAVVAVDAAGRPVGPVRSTYAEVPTGSPCALVGSSGRLEIACNGRSARDLLGLDRGASVTVRRTR